MKNIKTLILIALFALSSSCASSKTPTADLPLEQRAARMIIVGLPGVEIKPNSVIIEDITKRRVGGVILFESNVVTNEEKRLPAEELAKIDFKARLTKLCTQIREMADYPIIISIDQEGGMVNRLKDRYGFVPSETQLSLGEKNDESVTRAQAHATAKQLRELGLNTNFAPCVDVNINPECPAIGRFGRSFSSDAEVVATHAGYVMDEHHKEGIITAIKHFPGHGSSLNDTHLGITDVTSTWQECELIPYQKLLTAEGVTNNMVMVSHVFNANLDDKYPATLSHKIITGILRQKMGWDGVVITDDMHMKAITDHYTDAEAVTLTINAGTDMLILSSNLPTKMGEHITDVIINAIVSQVEAGAISQERINEAYDRIDALKL
ncbi:MAG: glycoside hydrolase family 3 N-terminal domain-containing protein [Rikenellaceae bacterium]